MTAPTFADGFGPTQGRGVDDTAVVVVVDLRGEPAAGLRTPIGAIQREQQSQLRRRGVDTSRVLVLAEAELLVEYREAFVQLAGAPSVTELLLLALGRQGGGDRIHLPPIPELPVLWAGDTRGVRWTPGQPGRTLGLDEDASANLAGLVRALRIPSVFTRVREHLRSCAHQAASPAIALLLGSVDREILDEAAGHAFGHFTQSGPAGSGVPLPDEAVKIDQLLTGSASQDVAGVGNIVDPRGSLPRAAAQARDHLEAAEDLITTLREEPFVARRSAPGGGEVPAGELVWTELVAAGTHLEELARGLHDALLTTGGEEGIGQRQVHALSRVGIRVGPVPAAEPGEVRAALRRQTDVALAAREPLAAIALRLRELAGRAAPTGSARYASQVTDICPGALFETLRKPPPFPRWLHTRTLSTAFVGALLAGLWFPWGLFGAALAIGVTVYLAVQLYLRRPIPQPKHSPDPRDVSRLSPLWFSLDAVVGGAIGVSTGASAGSIGVAIGLPLLVAGVSLTFAPLVFWRRTVDAWRRSLRLTDAAHAIRQLGDLLRRVALNEWVLANYRLGGARLASGLADAVEAAAMTLAERRPAPVGPTAFGSPLDGFPPGDVDPPGGTGPTGGFGPAGGFGSAGGDGRPGASGAEAVLGRDGGATLGVRPAISRQLRANQGALAEIVTDDVAAAIAMVINAHGEEIARERRDDITRTVHDALTTLLGAYDEHLERRGPLAAPPFEADHRRRTVVARKVWTSSPDLDRLRRATANFPSLVQLTNEEDLRLLDQTPDAAPIVRFVPTVADPVRDEGTGSPDIAGLIRLTQLSAASARRTDPPGARRARSAPVAEDVVHSVDAPDTPQPAHPRPPDPPATPGRPADVPTAATDPVGTSPQPPPVASVSAAPAPAPPVADTLPAAPRPPGEASTGGQPDEPGVPDTDQTVHMPPLASGASAAPPPALSIPPQDQEDDLW
jgi:hypothetical protein